MRYWKFTRHFMSKKSCKAAESIEDAIHDNRMFQVNCGTEKPVEPKFYGHLTLEHNI